MFRSNRDLRSSTAIQIRMKVESCACSVLMLSEMIASLANKMKAIARATGTT